RMLGLYVKNNSFPACLLIYCERHCSTVCCLSRQITLVGFFPHLLRQSLWRHTHAYHAVTYFGLFCYPVALSDFVVPGQGFLVGFAPVAIYPVSVHSALALVCPDLCPGHGRSR